MDLKAKIFAKHEIVFALANLGLIGLWIWLYRGVFDYLGIIFTRQEFRTNQIILAAVLILIFVQVRKGEYRLKLGLSPQFYPPALVLAVAASLIYLTIEHFLDINTFSASLFGLATYGFLGMWLRPVLWLRGLPAALLIIGALPFGEHLQTFVGYPVRVITAQIVRDGLETLGVGTFTGDALGVNTILVFENGISKVDLPCSGVKSLWTGGLFLLAATWIERRSLNFRWLTTLLVFTLLLLAANLARVAILVGIGQVAGWRLVAEMLHVPLGVLGFVGACLAGLGLLRWAGRGAQAIELPQGDNHPIVRRPLWVAPLMATVVLVMALAYSPRPETVLADSTRSWQFPTDLTVEHWPMSPGELEWLAKAGIPTAERWRFQFESTDANSIGSNETKIAELNGSMLFVSSTTWRAHHRPEACLEVYGLEVDQSFTVLAAPDFPVRTLILKDDSGLGHQTAAYWLQSPDLVTDDYASRIWSDLAPQRERWVLVTILFDGSVDYQSEQIFRFYQGLRTSIQANLQGGLSP